MVIDITDTNNNEFAALLDQYDFSLPERGQILEGIVLDIKPDEILIDVGLKRDAIVTRKDLSFLDEKVKNRIVLGEKILIYVLQPRNNDGDLIVSINKALELEDWREMEDKLNKSEVLEAIVIDTNRGGIMVETGRLVGFVPQSHLISLPRFASQHELQDVKRQLVGTPLSLKVIEVDRRRNRLILSERNAKEEVQEARLSELAVGQTVTGRVVSLVDFGAFVDLGGVDGLIHISKLSHNHVNHPGEVVAVGDEVQVVIDSIDPEKRRISLDRAALLPDPWDSIRDEYEEGQLIQTTVTNVVDFGVFAQLPNGLQGLIHISEMSMFGTQNPRDVLSQGDEVLARIVSIDPKEQRIALSIDKVSVDEQEDWMHARKGDEDEEFEGGEGEEFVDEFDADEEPAAEMETEVEETDFVEEVEAELEETEAAIEELPVDEVEDIIEETEAEAVAEELEEDNIATATAIE